MVRTKDDVTVYATEVSVKKLASCGSFKRPGCHHWNQHCRGLHDDADESPLVLLSLTAAEEIGLWPCEVCLTTQGGGGGGGAGNGLPVAVEFAGSARGNVLHESQEGQRQAYQALSSVPIGEAEVQVSRNVADTRAAIQRVTGQLGSTPPSSISEQEATESQLTHVTDASTDRRDALVRLVEKSATVKDKIVEVN